MKKSCAALLAGIFCLLLTACGATSPDRPAPTAEPTAAATAAAEPTPEPTEVPTPEPTAAPRFAAGEEVGYVLCEGKTDGAKALSRWLRSAGRDVLAAFIPEGLDTPMYIPLLPETAAEEELPAATDETRIVRVAADTELLESGILSAWLPAFEADTGFIAEVYAGDAAVLTAEAAAGTADVLLMKTTDASAAGSMTHYPLRYDLMTTIYSVIGGETP